MKALIGMLVVMGLSCMKAQSPAYRLFTMREGLSQMKITSLHRCPGLFVDRYSQWSQ